MRGNWADVRQSGRYAGIGSMRRDCGIWSAGGTGKTWRDPGKGVPSGGFTWIEERRALVRRGGVG
jgi:hypothetical protein